MLLSRRLSISLVTWNVWFDSLERTARYNHIFQTIQSIKPDIVCLQEVTPYFVEQLKLWPEILKFYSFSDQLDSASIIPYGVAVLCRKSLSPEFKFVALPTNMYRKLLITDFQIDKQMFTIGTVHLESLNNQKMREEQLVICSQQLNSRPFSLLCGDFNFCSYRNFDENSSSRLDNSCLAEILPEYIDIWPELKGPSNLGYTFDTINNGMLCGHPFERMRYDRIIYRSATSCSDSASSELSWRPVHVELLGVDPISSSESSAGGTNNASTGTPDAKMKVVLPQQPSKRTGDKGSAIIPIYPSDHFGLFAVFEKL